MVTMETRATQSEEQSQSEGRAMKFTFPSGSKPLSGYTIKRGVGRGGFGEVYFAVSDAGKEVALKLIRRNLDIELRGVRHCLNLKHPNLLAIHDIRHDESGDRWVVMEYIGGESLEQAIARNPNGMPPEEVTRWMNGIVGGVAYLHDHGIVHRDLKPGNIFSDEGIVKIGDYGLSKFIACSRRSGQTESVGTVHYMAPEIANGRYGKEIDLYALGIILFEMLTGRVPFEGESVGEVLMKHLTATPDLGEVAEPYRQIIQRALSKDPAHRFESAQQMLAALPNSQVGAIHSPQPNVASVGAPPAETPPHAVHRTGETEDEEPIWRTVKEAGGEVQRQWNSPKLNPILKLLILVGGFFLVVATTSIWFPVLIACMIGYGIYRFIRAIIRPAKTQPVVVQHRPPPGPGGGQEPAHRQQTCSAQRARRHSWRREAAVPLRVKPARDRMRELSGSMLLAAGVSLAMAVVMMVLRGQTIAPEQFAWLAAVGTLGSWAVLVPSKFWEGKSGESIPRRFCMLVIGLGLGGAACGLAQFLTLDLTYDMSLRSPLRETVRESLPGGFYGVDGSPAMMAHLAWFGFLMMLVRWWRLADPLRATRLGIWSTAVCLIWAWVLNLFWPFPQPWGFMITAIIAVSVQLASPWVERPDTART